LRHIGLVVFFLCAAVAAGAEREPVRVAVAGHPRDDWRSRGMARTTLAHLCRLRHVLPANEEAARRLVPDNVTAPVADVAKAGARLRAKWVVTVQAWEEKAVAWVVRVDTPKRFAITVEGKAHELPGLLATQLAARMRIPHSLVDRVNMAKPRVASAEAMTLLWQGAFEDDAAKQTQILRQAVGLDPDSALAVNYLGTALARSKRHDEALAAFRRAIELRPDFDTACTNQGSVLKALKRWDESMAAFQRAIDMGSRTAAPHLGQAALYDHLGASVKALDARELAVETDPSHETALLTLARAKLKRDNIKVARELAVRAIEVHPTSVNGWNLLGFIEMTAHKYKTAEIAFRKALSIRPDHPETLANLGFVLYARGKMGLAEARLKRAIELDPKHAKAHFFLGKVYLMEGRPNEAYENLQVAAELNPRHASARENLKRAREERMKPPSPACGGCMHRSGSSGPQAGALPLLLLFGPHVFRLSRRKRRR